MRLRVGNVQIGGHALLEALFSEPRFNSWSIGEVHVLDRRIVPNARRDDFEQNAHYSNLLNQLAPIARAVSKRCRTSSKRRQLLRDFELQEQAVKERLQILVQGGLRRDARREQSTQIDNALKKMTRLAQAQELEGEKEKLEVRIAKLQHRARTVVGTPPESPLDLLRPSKRGVYGQVIELIYECSANRVAAKALVDRILERIVRSDKNLSQAVKVRKPKKTGIARPGKRATKTASVRR